ncbi:hypothetical protein [Paraburkholderia sp. RL17-347-BIC-D]|uniref:hypothetical protein n=1 Tax=Paraburkholderia sp. RL17-347-BIC-D TaxID=3031632 RepID=UPI0038B77015
MKHIVTVAAIAVSVFANFDYAVDPALTFDAASNGAEVQERSSRDDVASSNTWSEVRRQLDESETKDGIKRLDGSLYVGH